MTISGDKIRVLHNRYNITQLDLACEIDCSREEIAKIEGGRNKNTGL